MILIGEMRDLETIAAALTIAETGHLVFATLHTNSTFESINRIVDVFPSNQQKQVLSQLAFVLKGVVTQQLIPRARGGGRVHRQRGAGLHAGGLGGHPRGEDASDLHPDAGRAEVRDADDEPGACSRPTSNGRSASMRRSAGARTCWSSSR